MNLAGLIISRLNLNAVETDNPFQARLRERLRVTKKSIPQVAKFCGVTPQAIYNTLNRSLGRTGEVCHFIEPLATALDVTPGWLMFGDEKPREANNAVLNNLSLQGLSPVQALALASVADAMRTGQVDDRQALGMVSQLLKSEQA